MSWPRPPRVGLASSVSGVLATRGLSILIAIFSLPAYIRFFPEASALGVWFTLLSVMGWLLTFDFGVGNGLRNRVAEGKARGDEADLRSMISSTYVVTLFLALVMGLLGFATVWLVNWNDAFNVSDTVLSRSTLRTGLAVVLTAILLQLVLRNSQSLLYAIQRPTLASSMALYTSCTMLAAVLLLPSTTSAGNFVALAWVYLGASVVPLLLVSLWIFTLSPLAGMSPRWSFASRHSARRVGGLGAAFFVMNLCYMAIVTTDTVIIAAISGAANVVDYQVYFRPFGLISSLFVIAMSPMWSAVTAAWAANDLTWIRKVVGRMFVAGIAASTLTCALVPVLQPMIDVWLADESIEVDLGYATAFAALAVATIWNSILSNVASGMGETRTQLSTYVCGALAKIPLSIWLCGVMGSWIGVVVATATALGVYAVVQTLWLRAKLASATQHAPDGSPHADLVAPPLRDREPQDQDGV